MEIITFTTPDTDDSPRVGALLNDEYLLDFVGAFGAAGRAMNHLTWLDMDGQWFQKSREIYKSMVRDPGLLTEAIRKGWLVKRSEAYWLAPVPRPGKILCIGLNYRDHAAESNMPIPERPVVFSKFATAVIAPGEAVVLPPTSAQVDYEAELAVVIGRRAKNVSASRAFDCVLGYTAFNDVSARDFQFADGQWQRGKSCDTFAPMGPKIVTSDVVPNPHKLSIKLTLNGQTMQNSNTDQLIFGVPQLIEFLSQTITLEPGDVIATGTPPGVGFARKPPVFLKAGDLMEVDIESVGKLNSQVVAGSQQVFSKSPE
ncbi:MAG TPA: fumarylacetoacetate hydrolase family protein [Pyrinomonadaceae bacterium]|jgi:2-keto-4-pentenoate hydratase/2-oxohepta-3-ene-1,7-dioic acid hydratase in catechol pathway